MMITNTFTNKTDQQAGVHVARRSCEEVWGSDHHYEIYAAAKKTIKLFFRLNINIPSSSLFSINSGQ